MDKLLRIELKVIKEEREYVFSLPYGAPHGEVYDAVYEILHEIVDQAKQRTEELKNKGEADGVK